jgi:hypothetical protein
MSTSLNYTLPLADPRATSTALAGRAPRSRAWLRLGCLSRTAFSLARTPIVVSSRRTLCRKPSSRQWPGCVPSSRRPWRRHHAPSPTYSHAPRCLAKSPKRSNVRTWRCRAAIQRSPCGHPGRPRTWMRESRTSGSVQYVASTERCYLGGIESAGRCEVLALGPTIPSAGTSEPEDLFGRPPESTQLRARHGNRADSNRCVAPLPQTAPEPS